MTFDDLLSDTFELATGKSRVSALRTKRYRQLCSEAPHIAYTRSREVAEMMLLGEMIADTAFATLPLKLRKLAKKWRHVGHDGQVEILNTLFKTLDEESLPQRQAQKGSFTANASLPHQYGKWGQGDLVPNCLGMSQILVGFARAAGARHMLVDTISRYDLYRNEYHYLRLRDLQDIIEPYRNNRTINALANLANASANETAEHIAEHTEIPESHALLSIRTDDEWWIIDPYFRICCKDTVKRKTLDRIYRSHITKHPERSATVSVYEAKKERIAEYNLAALRRYIPYLDKLDQPRSEWMFGIQGVSFVTSALGGYKVKNDAKAAFDYEMQTIHLYMRSLYPTHVYSRLLKDEVNVLKLDGDFIKDLFRRLSALDRTKRTRNQAFKRLMKGAIANTYCRIFDVDVAIDNPPTMREYIHPTLQLAVKTIDQIATARHVDAPQLIKFGSHQWLIYNMLGSVERSSSRRLQQILTRRIRRLQKNSWAILPQLRPYLSQQTGENHGK